MANVNSVQAAQLAPQGGSSANCNVFWGRYEITSALSANDTITFGKIPAGATVLTGWLYADDIDTGTETLEIDIGDASDPDRFLNSGVLTGDVVTGTKPEATILIQCNGTLKDGPYTYSSETDVIGTITAAANAGGTGTVSLMLLYTFNDARVSPPEKPV